MNNKYLRKFINHSILSVKDGKGIALPLKESGEFPSILLEMISTGEETGTLEKLSIESANFLENETESNLKRLVSMIEPVSIIFIGILVAIISASFLLPIFRMASTFKH